MATRIKAEAAPYLVDETTGRIVGFRNSDGSDTFFSVRASEGGGGTVPDGQALTFLDSGGTGDTFLVRDGAANTLAQRNGTGTSEQRFSVYRTGGTPYERGSIVWSSGVLTFGLERGVGGAERVVRFQGSASYMEVGISTNPIAFQFVAAGSIVAHIRSNGSYFVHTDGGGNIGAVGANRPGSGFFTTALVVGTTTAAGFLALGAATTAKPHINFTAGVAPTSPVDGDMWFDGTNWKVRQGGTTKTVTII